ncbi:MAG TPA: hypothetical protein VHA07_03030 [Devosia sp.]|nr:hypothetical protein [Devosia sp.]
MKSFSSSSFASDNAVALDLAAEAVRDNPQALFTDFQWFLFEGKDTIFFTAFSKHRFDAQQIQNLTAQMVALAPQLTHGFVGARPGHPFPQHILDAITSVEEVESFEGYPDKWLSTSRDLFNRDDLPLFRVMAANLKGGPDGHGRASIIQVRSAHCLLEGSDAALLTRSQTANHGIQSDASNKVAWATRAGGAFRGYMMAAIHYLVAMFRAQEDKPMHFKTLPLERQRMRELARRLGVRQRSLFFALVTYALHSEKDRRLNEKVITAAYTMLDTKRTASDDDFFRVRALEAKFPYSPDLATYVRNVDKAVDDVEQKDITKFQQMVLAMFGAHRALHRIAPWMHGERFWRYSGETDVVLTLVPPHRSYGPLADWMIEPIYCGAYHPATNLCTFCPGRDYMTLNFVMEQKHIDNVGRIEGLIAQLEAAV